MSGATQQPPPAATLPGSPAPAEARSQFGGPWKRIGLWAAAIAAVLLIFLVFSGRISLLGRSEKVKPSSAEVTLPDRTSILTRPAEPKAEPPPAKKAEYTPPGRGVLGSSGDNNAGLASPISAWKPTRQTQTGKDDTNAKSRGGIDGIRDDGALEAHLKPTQLDGTSVAELPNPRWNIEQGRQLPCILQTKINSSLPGGVTAIIPEPIRGETGDTTLLPAGAKVFGTIQRGLQTGGDRLAVLWQNITTPVLYDRAGMPRTYRIAVNSPSANELGETGQEGEIDRHLAKKIGGILGFSLFQGAMQAGVNAAQQSGNTTFNFNSFQQGGNTAAQELLRQWVNIPDVLTAAQGGRCIIFVMRDLNFRAAYKLMQTHRISS